MYDVLINGTITFLIKDGTYRLSNSGTVKSGSATFPALSDNELNTIVKETQKTLDYYSNILYEYLDYNQTKFPEFIMTSNIGDDAYQSYSTRDIYIDKEKLFNNMNPYSNKTYF